MSRSRTWAGHQYPIAARSVLRGVCVQESSAVARKRERSWGHFAFQHPVAVGTAIVVGAEGAAVWLAGRYCCGDPGFLAG